MTDLPLKVPTRLTAINEAIEISRKQKIAVYLYAVIEGGYYIDNLKRDYSNEKLIHTFLKGKAI